MSSTDIEDDSDFKPDASKPEPAHESVTDSTSSSSSSSEFQIKVKTKPKANSKLNNDLDKNTYSNFESEVESSPAELNLGTDTSNSTSDSPIESDNEQNSDSESNIDTDLGTSSFSNEPSEQIEKIIGINYPTFSEQNDQIMYFVKYKDQSYRSCQWVQEEDLLKTVHGKIIHTTFCKNPTPFKKVHFFSETVSELFKPSKVKFDEGFIIPERILSIQTKSESKKYLVKWISLDFKESTWETDVPDRLIDQYEANNSQMHRTIYDHSENGDDEEFDQLTKSPIYQNFNELFEYQIEALNWSLKNWRKKRNMILCDTKEMGRTIEIISILDRLSKIYGSWGPFLIVCPSSSVNQWVNEIENWTEFRIVCLTGNKNTSKIVKQYMMFHHIDDENKLDITNVIFDILIVSYESLPREISFLKKFDFNFMFAIFDEAQKLKKFETNIYKDCMSIKAQCKLLLTGCLSQYDMDEIWSLFHFISPSKYHDFEKFEKNYRIKKYQDERKKFVLTRKKSDIIFDSPKNEETIVESEMTHLQRNFAQNVVKNHLMTLSNISASKSRINNFLTTIQKIFCHPFLDPELEPICLSQYKEMNGISKHSQLDSENEMYSIIFSSGKMILFDKIISKLKEEKRKVLVFSSMQKMLDIIEDYLILKEYLYERLDGSYSLNKRTFSIERFQKIDEVFIILISPESGGIGVDITGADTVLIYDGEYNSSNDILIQSKIHEENKSKDVNFIRLTTHGCCELEFLLNELSSINFESSNDHKNSPEIDDEDSILKTKNKIQTILRKSCYHIFNDDSNEIDIFSTQDVNEILENRSHTREEIEKEDDETKIIKKDDFWDDFLFNSETSSEIDDFDFNTGIKPRTKRKPEKKDDEEYDCKTTTNNNNEEESSNSSTSSDSDPSFSLSNDDDNEDDEENPELNSTFPFANDEEFVEKPINDSLYTISFLNQNLFTMPKLYSKITKLSVVESSSSSMSSSSDLEKDDLTDDIDDLNTSELKDSIVLKICTESLDNLRKHGIAGARLYTSETFLEIGKTLIVLAFSKLLKKEKKKFKRYIHEHIPSMKKQLLKTPYKELDDDNFISSLFNGQELKILQECFKLDKIYKVALFVSTEKLPEKFTFAPEMSTPLGWTAIDDFIALTASPLFNDISEIADDEKLPFGNFSKSFPSFKKWIKKRIELIVNEVSIIIPPDFRVYDRYKGSLIPKKFGDVKVFKNLNYHVVNPKTLSVNFQKKLLRILYFYGLPKTDGIQKIKKILKLTSLDIDKLIYFFIEKVLIESIKIKPNLIVLLNSFTKVAHLTFNDVNTVNIKWISKKVIREVALKIDLFYNVREKFKEKDKLIDLPSWSEIESSCTWWNSKCDRNFFRATAYYGFLFNSMLCSLLPKMGVNDIDVIKKWREDENESLEPLLIPEVENLKDIFSIEKREKRIEQILDFLESKK